jgi:hypothetical protein
MRIDLTRREMLALLGAAGSMSMAPAALAANRSRLDAASQITEDMPSIADYGPLDVADHTALFATALADAARNNTTGLRLPPHVYSVSSTLKLDRGDFHLLGTGATITSAMTSTQPLINVLAEMVSITGLRTVLTARTSTSHHYRVSGRNCHVHLCTMEYASEQNTPAFYVRGGDGFQLTNCTKRGSNAFLGFLEASDVLIASNKIFGVRGGDDAIALKAINQSCENIRIINNYVQRHASIVSFGSQIGRASADDLSHSRAVRGVVVEGNIADMCGRLAYIKPGALRADYRDGLVEHVVFSGNRLNDPEGVMFEVGFDIRAGRGAIVRNIRGSDNMIRARAAGDSSTGRKIGALLVQAAGGGSTSTIEDVDVEIAYEDPYDGEPYGTAETAGYPVANIVRIDPMHLRLGKVNLRITGNGCSESGILILSGADRKVVVEKLRLKHYNSRNLTSHGGFRTASSVILANSDLEMSGNGRAWIADRGGSFMIR